MSTSIIDAVLDKKAKQPSGDQVVMNTPDGGRVVQTASGLAFVSPRYSTTDQDEIQRIMESFGAINPTEEKRREFENIGLIGESPLAAAALKASQGIPFIGEYIPEMVGAVSPDARQRMEAIQRATEEQAPGKSLVARIAGSAPFAVMAPGAVGGSMANQTLRGGGLAALESGVSGFGAAEGEFLDRLGPAARDAALGATLGTLFSGATSLLTRGSTSRKQTDAAIKEISEKLNVSPGAGMIIANTIRGGGTLEDALSAIQRAGDSGMLADSSLATKNLLDAVMTLGAAGEAASVGREAVEGRASEMSAQLGQMMDEVLGAAPTGKRTIIETISGRSAPARNAAYKAAYSSPIDYTSPAGDAILSIVNRIPSQHLKKAIKDANDLMQLEGITDRQIKATVASDGSVVFQEQPNVIQLDFLKRGLQDIAYGPEFFDPITQRPKGTGIALDRVAGQLRAALGKAVPQYDQAVKLGGDAILERQAVEMGSTIFRPSTTFEEVLYATREASADQLAAMRLAARGQLEELMTNARNFISTGGDEGVAAARKAVMELGTVASRRKLQAILPPGAYRQLNKKLEEVRSSLELLASVAPNSATARRREVGKQIDEMLEPGFLGSIARGEPLSASKRMISVITGTSAEVTEQERQKILADIARGMTEQRGPQVQAALRYIKEAMDQGSLSDAKAAFINEVLQRAGLPITAEGATAAGIYMDGDS